MPASLFPSSAEMLRFLPELILTGVGTLIMVLEPLTGEKPKNGLGHLSIAGLVAALAASVAANANPGPAFSSMLLVDGFATFFRVLVIVVGILTILASYRYLTRENANRGEYFALILFSVVGQCVMVTANELIMIFIGLEISSIATYVLAGQLRDDPRANESALKYFLLGSFATAFLLYGIAFIYGATGSTNLLAVREAVLRADSPSPLLLALAASLMMVGFGFKISGVPFQMWAPDVYQGAPAPVAAFMSAGPKAAAFAIFLRVFITIFEPIGERWGALIWVSALLSMTLGNFAALTQTNVKRMLAYSSIAHAGYVLVALCARSEVGTAAAMFYLAAYALMNVGAFAVVAYLCGKGEKYVAIDDLAGLGARRPLVAAALALFMCSLIGIPLTGGFFGKFYIFKAALQSKLIWLTVLGLLNSAVAAFYYLSVMVVMYMHEPGEAVDELEPLSPGLRTALLASAAGVLILGVFPSSILDFAVKSAKMLSR
ncbi:MAG: NADH-quinone oxidoreductase subunit N [Bryobacteraceae bacterium]